MPDNTSSIARVNVLPTLMMLICVIGVMLFAAGVQASDCHQMEAQTDMHPDQNVMPNHGYSSDMNSSDMSCCQQQCECPMAACGSVSGAAIAVVISQLIPGTVETIPAIINLYSLLTPTTLFKPPMAA